MDYLTVKDVAELVRRNEETIRRMIRARKLDVTLDNNNRHQGYQIPVDELTRTWAITREEVERYIEQRRAQEQAKETRRPLGPERAHEADAASDSDDARGCTTTGEHAHSAELAKQVQECPANAMLHGSAAMSNVDSDVSAADDGANGNVNVGAKGTADNGVKSTADNKTKLSSGIASGGDIEPDTEANAPQVEAPNADGAEPTQPAGAQADGLEEWCIELGDAVARALTLGAARVAGEMEQMATSAQRAWNAARKAAQDAVGGSDMDGDWNGWHDARTGQPSASRPGDTAHDRPARDEASTSDWEIDLSAASERVSEIFGDAYRQIRKAVERATANAPGSERDRMARRTAGQTGDIAAQARRTLARRHSDIRNMIAQSMQVDEAKQEHMSGAQSDRPEQSSSLGGACPAAAPEFEEFRGRQPEFDLAQDADIGERGFMDAEDNASYQLLQAARRAVRQRMDSMCKQSADSAQPPAHEGMEAHVSQHMPNGAAADAAMKWGFGPSGDMLRAAKYGSMSSDHPTDNTPTNDCTSGSADINATTADSKDTGKARASTAINCTSYDCVATDDETAMRTAIDSSTCPDAVYEADASAQTNGKASAYSAMHYSIKRDATETTSGSCTQQFGITSSDSPACGAPAKDTMASGAAALESNIRLVRTGSTAGQQEAKTDSTQINDTVKFEAAETPIAEVHIPSQARKDAGPAIHEHEPAEICEFAYRSSEHREAEKWGFTLEADKPAAPQPATSELRAVATERWGIDLTGSQRESVNSSTAAESITPTALADASAGQCTSAEPDGEDVEAMRRRIAYLESQLSRLTKQLDDMTHRLSEHDK